jgi:hypothetical protein
MSLVTTLGEMLKSGKVTISVNNIDAVEVKAENKKINISALDKNFVKETLSAASDKKSNGIIGKISSARNNLGMLKDVAEELSDAGLTVAFSYKGDVVVTMGSEAKPKLSSILTKTKSIEINSPRKLIELGV